MHKKLVLLGLVLLSVMGISVSALELDSEELRRALQSSDLEFINYQGPYDIINTVEQIRGIGRTLGKEIISASSANFFGKYRIMRVLDTNTPDKLSADLYIIEANAEVDSITNIRRMLSGYLADAFKYSPEDADLLAKLTTIYNAIYRGDMKNVTTHYVSAVADQVSEDNVGLARVYSQWAGRTRMLIPLRSSVEGGPASLVDVNALTTDQVMNTLIASERNPSAVAQQVVDQKDQTNQEEQKNLTEVLDILSVRQQGINDQQKNLEEELTAAKRGEGSRRPEEIQRELEEVKTQQEALARQKEEGQEQQEKLNEDEQKTDEGREQVQKLIQESQQPVSEAQSMTADESDAQKPASDNENGADSQKDTQTENVSSPSQAQNTPAAGDNAQNKQPAQQTNNNNQPAENTANNNNNANNTAGQPGQTESAILTPADQANSEVVAQTGNLIYFTRIIDGPKGVGQALLVDSTNRKILAQSVDLNVMRGSSVLRGDELIIVTLEKDGSRLKALDAKTLAEKSQALYLVHARSTMNAASDAIYLVVEKDNNWYLARFGKELTVGEVLSEDAVMPYTEIRLQEGIIYVESANGDILKLDPATLKQKK